MRVVAITNLFPNARQPNRGVFNLQQFAALGRHGDLRVVAPLPWQPWSHGFSRPIPLEEAFGGIRVTHPLHVYVPWLGRAANGVLMAASLQREVTRVVREHRPEVLLGAWAYPDAVATALLARRLGLPWVAKVHGSDLNVIARDPLLGGQIRWALRQAAGVVAVSNGLKERVEALGVPSEKVRVLHNGVNLDRFGLQERAVVRERLGLPQERRTILFVGNLLAGKGALDLLDAVHLLAAHATEMPLLVYVGGGKDREILEASISRYGMDAHIRLVGPRPHEEVPDWIAAADLLCLPSHNEGCPNVVLEALACGRPVVATRVGAIPDFIDERTGALVLPRDTKGLAAALESVLTRVWDAEALRRRVQPLSWEENAATLAAELERAARRYGAAREGMRDAIPELVDEVEAVPAARR
jgi:glycosyltransferase involved in cell wall biosynthesis